ncbi:MAG: AsmA family protein, partial [Sphingomonadales bacterium]
MKKALFIIGGLFLVLLASALVAPSLVDWNQYKGQVQSAVRSFTGKDVQIGGNLSLRIVPSLQISAADVRLANEEGWRAPYFLELDSLDVSAAFFPLLTGKVQVTSITLKGARINLEINADGLGNWEALAGKSEAKPGGKEKAGSGDGFQLDDFRIEGGEIVLSDSRRGTVEMITGIDAGLSAGSARGPFHVDGGLTYRGQRIGLKASLGRLFDDRRSPFNINLVLGGEEPGLGLSGSILFEGGRPILAGKMEVSGGDLGALADALSGLLGGGPIDGINLAQAYSIKSKLAFGGGRVLLEEIELRVGKTAGSGKVLIDFQEKIEGSASIRLNTVVVEDWLVEGAKG